MFFKITTEIKQLIDLSELKSSLVGCSPLCDWQVISLEDLNLCLNQLKNLHRDLVESIQKQYELMPTANPEESKKQERDDVFIPYKSPQRVPAVDRQKLKDMEKQRDQLFPLVELQSATFCRRQIPVFVPQHMCNALLKSQRPITKKHPVSGQEIKVVTAADLIAFHDSMLTKDQSTLEDLSERFKESKQDIEKRNKFNTQNMARIAARKSRRDYNKLTGGVEGF